MKQFTGKFSEVTFYKYVIAKCCIVNDGSSSLYAYRKSEGMWVRADDEKMKILLYGFIDEKSRILVKEREIKSIICRLKCDPKLVVNFEEVNFKNETLLNVKNGVVDLNTGQLHEHMREGYFTYCLDFEYKSDVEIEQCEAFMNFVKSSLSYDINKFKTIRLLEMIGYVISSLIGAEKCFIMVGVSNSGKSVMLNVVEKVVGKNNTTNIPINKLGDRFNIGELRNSRVNIHREVSGSELKHIDIFKSICSAERLTGERKCKDPFSFNCRCKLLFAGNCLPEIKQVDNSNNAAIFNRFCILYFPRGVEDKEKDLALEERIFKERNTIFSVAVNVLMDLKKRKYVFTEDVDSAKYLENYIIENQSLKHFVADRCIVSGDLCVHSADLIAAFKKYCKENAFEYRYTNGSVKAYLTSLDGVYSDKFRIDNSAPLWGYKGIGLNTSENCNDTEQD